MFYNIKKTKIYQKSITTSVLEFSKPRGLDTLYYPKYRNFDTGIDVKLILKMYSDNVKDREIKRGIKNEKMFGLQYKNKSFAYR